MRRTCSRTRRQGAESLATAARASAPSDRWTPQDGEQLYEVHSAGINYADTHQRASCN
jgi:NADPH:quinone reductase-like Zn-dependent oxidoreductase